MEASQKGKRDANLVSKKYLAVFKQAKKIFFENIGYHFLLFSKILVFILIFMLKT